MTLLARSDFVSLNCDLNPTSYHLMNATTLNHIKPTAVLINTSRGPVVDEPALISALQAGKLAGAAMDVFENEPLLDRQPPYQDGQRHAGSAQCQFQPQSLGTGTSKYDRQPAGWVGVNQQQGRVSHAKKCLR